MLSIASYIAAYLQLRGWLLTLGRQPIDRSSPAISMPRYLILVAPRLFHVYIADVASVRAISAEALQLGKEISVYSRAC